MHFPDAVRIRLVEDNLNTHDPAALYEVFPPAEAKRLVDRLSRLAEEAEAVIVPPYEPTREPGFVK